MWRRAILIGVVAVFVAAKLLQKADFAVCRPLDQRYSIKGLCPPAIHSIFKIPFHNRLLPLVEKLPDLPLQNGPACVPLVEPEPDFFDPVVFGPPAFDVNRVLVKNRFDPHIAFLEPHRKP